MGKKENKFKFGISFKTAFLCGIIVLILLTINSFIALKIQSGLAQKMITAFELNEKKSLDEQSKNMEKVLVANSKINLEICSGVAQSFLYNFSQNNMNELLQSFIKIDEIVAINVLDVDKGHFSAAWKNPNVQIGEKFPDNFTPDENLSVVSDAIHEGEKVGTVQIYYTKSFVNAEIKKKKQATLMGIEDFSRIAEKSIKESITIQVVVTAVIIISLIITIVVCLKIIVGSPIKNTLNMIKDIAQGEGDLTRRLLIKSSDEIGELSLWFNIFVEKLQTLIKDVSQNAITVDESSNELTGISNSMTRGTGDLSDKATNVAASAEEMSTNMNSVAAASEEASTNLNRVAATIDEMTITINEIFKNSQEASSITRKAVEQAKDAVTKVDELGMAARDISKVTEVITEISGQTNLLALNATIEAARAGEAGKGFAVVANEIKALAKQTADATLEIKEKIETIQGSTENSVSKINAISSVIKNVDDIVAIIASAMNQQSSTTGEIAENVRQASAGIQEVNENVAQSSSVSEEIAKDIAQMNTATNDISNSSAKLDLKANGLSELAGNLKKMVSKFKI